MTSVLATAKRPRRDTDSLARWSAKSVEQKHVGGEGGRENVEISTPKMKEAERALFLLFISVEFWQEKRESVDGWSGRGCFVVALVTRPLALAPEPRP